ncbi:MAG: di/tricarboxylate transporter, partial [Halieaceae bacterium]
GIATLFVSSRLLPSHSIEVVDVNEYLIEAEVNPGSTLIGNTILDNKLRDLKELFLVEIVRGEHLISPVSPFEYIEAGDKLIFSGDVKQLSTLEELSGLTFFALEEGLLKENVVEALVLPNAAIEGKTLKTAGFRSLFDAAVVGMRRGGKRLSGKLGNISLQAGDSLILAVGPDFHERKNLSKNFVIIDDEVIGARAKPLENYFVSLGLLVVIVLAGLSWVPLIKGLALLLLGMLVLGIVKGAELRRRFPFELWLIIASALTLAQALNNSGLVAIATHAFHDNLAGLGPYAAVAAIFLMTLVLTEIMTNNAAAALAFPIAFALAESYGLNYMPFIMAVAYGASASFLTPYGYTTNLMVQNLGGYQFRDYLRAGLPMTVVYSIGVLTLVPIFFPF